MANASMVMTQRPARSMSVWVEGFAASGFAASCEASINVTALKAELSHLMRLAYERSLEVAIAEVVNSAFEAALVRSKCNDAGTLPGMM